MGLQGVPSGFWKQKFQGVWVVKLKHYRGITGGLQESLRQSYGELRVVSTRFSGNHKV